MERKQRIAEVIEELMNQLPFHLRTMARGFCPDCLRLLEDIDEEVIDNYINIVHSKLDYIENGVTESE